jgi:hypothetical protein
MKPRHLFMASMAIIASVSAAAVRADTEFTYQGSLKQNGQLASGSFNFEFSLWSAPAGGSQVGPTNTKNGVQVSNGVFNVVLDFGGAAFNNNDRWLEVKVNSVTLSPRQWITRSPYAIQTRGIHVNDNETFAGIGRSAPINDYEILGLGNAANDWAGMYVRTGANGRPFYGYSLDGAQSAYHYLDGATDDWHLVNGGFARLTVRNDGFVGVGRDTPVSSSEVFGVGASTNGFGGMYVRTGTTGEPFYGYSRNGDISAYHYVDGATGDWNLVVGGLERINVADTGWITIGEAETSHLRVHGAIEAIGDLIAMSVDSGSPCSIVRDAGTEGTLILFFRDALQVGSISVTGDTVSYNSFTGSHYGWTDQAPDRGTLMVMTGENHRRSDDPGAEPVYGVAPSTTPNNPRCLGAYLGVLEPSNPPSFDNPHQIMAVGNGEMWVVDSGSGDGGGRDIEPGDYLISSDVEGHAMLDDAVRFPVGHVIARAAEPVDWEGVTDRVDGRRRQRVSVFFESFERGNAAGLATLVERQQSELQVLREESDSRITLLQLENDDLRARLARLEALVAPLAAGQRP